MYAILQLHLQISRPGKWFATGAANLATYEGILEKARRADPKSNTATPAQPLPAMQPGVPNAQATSTQTC